MRYRNLIVILIAGLLGAECLAYPTAPLQTTNTYARGLDLSVQDPARNQTIVFGRESYLGRRPPKPSDPPAYGIWAIDNKTGDVKAWTPHLVQTVDGVTEEAQDVGFSQAAVLGDYLYVMTWEVKPRNGNPSDVYTFSQIYKVELNGTNFQALLKPEQFPYIDKFQVYAGALYFTFRMTEMGNEGLARLDGKTNAINSVTLENSSRVWDYVIYQDKVLTCQDSKLIAYDLQQGRTIPWGLKTYNCSGGIGPNFSMMQDVNGQIVIGGAFQPGKPQGILMWDPRTLKEQFYPPADNYYSSEPPSVTYMRVIGNHIFFGSSDQIYFYYLDRLDLNNLTVTALAPNGHYDGNVGSGWIEDVLGVGDEIYFAGSLSKGNLLRY